jgi:hypothetical protein
MMFVIGVVCALGAVAARGDGPEEVRAKRLRDQLPEIDMGKFADLVEGALKGSDADLEAARTTLLAARETVLKKWRTIGRLNLANALAGHSQHFRAAENTMAVWGKEQERRTRLEEIDRRQSEEWAKRFGRNPDPKAHGPEMDELNRKYADERAGVQAWFRGEMEAAKRSATGGNDADAADRVFDAMREDTRFEMTRIWRSLKNIDQEIARRKGVADGEGKPDDGERARYDLRVVPYHTEYEAKTGETVETMFQVFKGAKPYTVLSVAPGTVEGPQSSEVPEPGDVVVPFTFRNPGEYPATVHVRDAQGADKAVSVTIRVTGAPWKPEPFDDGTKKTGSDAQPPPEGPTGSVPQRLEGTFAATIWHCNAELPRIDEAGQDNWLHVTGVPANVTIDASGRITATVRYELPQAEMHPDAGQVPHQDRFWKVSFDLEGHVDWTTGKTALEIRNGHDERGYEKDEPKTDNNGRRIGIFGHWRDRMVADYSASLEGWTLPGPDADAWGARLAKIPELATNLRKLDLETLGLPGVAVAADGRVAFRDRGFFGASDLGVAAPGGAPPRRLRFMKYLIHTGYDGMNAKDVDETAARQARQATQEKAGVGGWYVKILGAADAAPAAPAEPKKGDLLGFGLWPVKPIAIGVGGVARVKAMGVFGDDVYAPVDLTTRATWTASPGLTEVGPGQYSAAAPGTYTITVTHPGTSGAPMSSTITVIVK